MATDGESEPSTQFGSQTPFAEPSWYNSNNASPYYNEHHVKFRNKIRAFVDEEITPFVEEWEEAGEIPGAVYARASEVGLLPAIAGWPDVEDGQQWPGRPDHYDGFFAVIAGDELARCANGGIFWGLVGGMSIGLPPVLHSDNEALRNRVLGPVLRGTKRIALAVSEPDAGSDVGGLKTTAEDKGDYWLVNGTKKWITCGTFADYFSTAVRTGGPDSGMFGLDLILIERTMPGVSTRAMACMGVRGSGTAYVEFDNVKVPKTNYIGGVTMLLQNFVTERIGLAIQACRFARICLAESIECVVGLRRPCVALCCLAGGGGGGGGGCAVATACCAWQG
jgi:alkylation response protein AidB-like acyl-CoA dehydrogenase